MKLSSGFYFDFLFTIVGINIFYWLSEMPSDKPKNRFNGWYQPPNGIRYQ